MAEALFQAELPEHTVASAGLSALNGHPADPHSQALMLERGLDISAHRGRSLTQALCDESDIIFVMDSMQKQELLRRYPTARGKLYKLGDPEGFDIFDPHRMDRLEFERCLALIDKGINVWRSRVRAIL